MFTTTAHNVRIFALMVALVATGDYPMGQAVVYLVSSILGTAWDLLIRSYPGGLVRTEAFFMDAAKLAAACGYVALTVPSTGEQEANRICEYEVGVLAGAIGGGLAISVVGQVLGVYQQAKEWCCGGHEQKDSSKVWAVTSSGIHSGETSMTQNTCVGRLGKA